MACFSFCQRAVIWLERSLQVGQLLLQLLQAFLGSLVLFLLERLALDLQLHDLAVHLVQCLRLGVDLGAQAGGGLVDQVDGLVGQVPVGDVALAERGRGDHGRVGDAHAVMDLVALLEAAQDRDGILHARLLHHHRLEAALEGGVLLHVFAVLIQGGGADHVQLAARQHGLEHVAGVHRAFGLACPDHGVHFIHEQDDLALRIR